MLQERLIGGQRGQKTFTGSQKRKVSFVQSMVNLSTLIMVFHCHFCSAGFFISFVKADRCTKLSCINNIFCVSGKIQLILNHLCRKSPCWMSRKRSTGALEGEGLNFKQTHNFYTNVYNSWFAFIKTKK